MALSGGYLRVLLVDAQGGWGAALALALVRLGAAVTWFGRHPASLALPEVTVLAGDRRVAEDLHALAGSFDAVVDCGARAPEDPGYLAAHLRGRVGLVVQLSTWRVYAGAEDAPDCSSTVPPSLPSLAPPLPLPEDAPKRDGPALGAEDALWAERARGGYPATVLRLPPLYGPGIGMAREWHVVARLRAGRRQLAVPDDGGQLLHRVYVDNAVHAVVRLLDRPHIADGRAWHVGDSTVPTAAALCRQVAEILGERLEVLGIPRSLYEPHNPWAVPVPVVLDLSQVRWRLGYTEPVSPAEGLERTVHWLWDLPEEEVAERLQPYLQRFGCGHDYAAEDAALRRWQSVLGGA